MQDSKKLVKKSAQGGVLRADTLHLVVDAFQTIVSCLPEGEVSTLETLHPLMLNWMPVRVVVLNN